MLHGHLLLLISAVTGFFLPLSLAELTGILSQSAESPELITIGITNQGPRHVALLKHNTVLDISHLSMPCRVTDEKGRLVPVIASHVMYNGVSKDDLLDLPPGSNFTRALNMTEYLIHDDLDHAQSFRTVTVSLPPTFQGRKHRDGYDKPHPDSLGRISGPYVRGGNASKAILSDVPLRSNPLQMTIVTKQNPWVLEKRQVPQFNGLKLNTGGPDCTPAQIQNYSNAILHTKLLGVAGQNAASNYNALPFNYFMPATIEASNKVGQAMSNMVQAEEGKGPPVLATCTDALNNCKDEKFGYAMFVTGGHPSYIPRVVMCPLGLMLPDITLPCQGLPGATTTAYVLLHELMHIDEISGIRATDWVRPNNYQSARNVHKDLLAGKDTTTDSVALGMVGSWAWELGLGVLGGATCLDKFYQGNLDSLVWAANGKQYSG